MAEYYDFDLERDKHNAQMDYWAGLLNNEKASIKEQKAARKAQDAYNSKLLDLQRQGLGLQAEQMAKQYAMQQAQLEWEKESFRMEFGETQRHNEWERAFNDRQQQLDEVWRTAEQTGFRDGVPTLANLEFQESQRQFDLNRVDSARDFGESQRQFNVSTVMNAQRGPADWAAYTSKLRGLQSSGALPGALGTMFDPSAQVASYSNAGQPTGPVLTNAQLAMAQTGLSSPSALQGTVWQQGGATQSAQSSQSSQSSNPYSETGTPAGGGDRVAAMLGQSSPGSMELPSAQKFRRYAPTEQEMGLGYLAESGGPTEDDAKYMMERQAPQFKRSNQARYAGI